MQIYSVVNVPAGKSFVLHFDYILNESRHVRLSISNIFKEFKVRNKNMIFFYRTLMETRYKSLCKMPTRPCLLVNGQLFASIPCKFWNPPTPSQRDRTKLSTCAPFKSLRMFWSRVFIPRISNTQCRHSPRTWR